jgi:hypothetical protein
MRMGCDELTLHFVGRQKPINTVIDLTTNKICFLSGGNSLASIFERGYGIQPNFKLDPVHRVSDIGRGRTF